MLYYVLIIPVSYMVYRISKKYTRSKPMRIRTLLDVQTVEDGERLLQCISHQNDSSDMVANKLIRIYSIFPPTEEQMQIWSHLQQAHQHSGGRGDFVITTIYGVASIALQELNSKPLSRRCRSWPLVKERVVCRSPYV